MSSQASRIRWNSFYALLSQLIRLVTNFLLFVGVARFYGAEVFGQFTTAHSMATIFLLFADFGFDTLLVTEISRQHERAAELAKRYFSLKIFFALAATIAMMGVPLVMQLSPQTKILVEIFSFYVLFSSLNNFFFALFKGYEEFHHETRISFGVNLLLLLFLVAFGVFKLSIVSVALVFVFIRVVGTVVAGKTAVTIIGGGLIAYAPAGWRESWSDIVVFGFYAVFGNLFFLLDTLLLSAMKGDHEVGLYQSVFKLILIAMVLQDIATNTMTPVLSRLHRSGYDQWQKIGKLLNKTLLFIALPIVAIIGIYAEKIINVIYGEGAFSGAIPILRVFGVVIILRYSAEAYGMMLTTSLRHRARLSIVVGATVLNICLNCFFIPRFGAIGAAWTSVLTNFAVCASYMIVSGCPISEWTLEARNLAMVALIGVLSVVVWSVGSISFWIGIPVIIVAYAVALLFVGFTRWELDLIFRKKEIALSI